MSQPESDPNEQANISGADFAIMCDELKTLRAELTEARLRASELERQVCDKHEAATVDEICNAYESGIGHRGRPTANVNPYRKGSDLATAYNIGAVGDREPSAPVQQPAVPEAVAVDSETKEFFLSHRFDQLGKYTKDRALILLTEAGFNFVRAAILAAKEKGQ